MAWGSKKFVAKSNAIGKGLTPAVAGFDASGAPVLVDPNGSVIELPNSNDLDNATAMAISVECASGGVISAAIDAAIAAHVAAYQHTPAE